MVKIQVLGCEIPESAKNGGIPSLDQPVYPGGAEAYSSVLEKYEERGIDAIFSFSGVPRKSGGKWDLGDFSIYNWAQPPLFLVELGLSYDPDMVRMSIEKGRVHAATIIVGSKPLEMKVITKDNLGELPVGSPIEESGQTKKF